MSTTLVSFIGTGWRKKEAVRSTYDQAKYDFGDSKIIETSMFFNAILRSQNYNLSDAIIIGTKTSAWATLLEHHLNDAKYDDLYLKLEEELYAGQITSSTLSDLEVALSCIWNMPVKCLATDSEINEQNAFDIISVYLDRLANIENDNLLIDITHGFRSMPILLMSALQFSESIKPVTGSIGIIYGEFKSKGIPSPVRHLDAIWRGITLSRAMDSFFQKFDASELSSLVEPFWPSGANAIANLGDSLQGNLLIWLNEPLKQLNNALNKPIENLPKWFPPVKKRITALYHQLNKPQCKYELCLCIAAMFAERRIYGQATIALQLSFEAFLFEYYNISDSFYGNFEKTKELTKKFYKIKELKGKDKAKLRALNNTRNMIAHGGSRSTHGGKPAVQSLPSQYSSYKNLLERIINKLT